MGGLLLKLQNFKKVKLIFGHPVFLHLQEMSTLIWSFWDYYGNYINCFALIMY